MILDPQAVQLNQTISSAHPSVMDMLSERGKSIFFPKSGILAQSADAAGKEINATIGIALEEDSGPMCLPSLSQSINLPAANVFPYAPSPGRPDIRKLWKEMVLKKNPGLTGKTFSLPVVCAALTHGLSMCAYLFCEESDEIILPDLYWENYELLFTHAYGAELKSYPTYTAAGGFNVEGLREALRPHSGSLSAKKIVLLNFPNNPSGYTPTVDEVREIVVVLKEAAEHGNRLVVLVDDAYFGLVYEEGVYKESVFADLCDLHPNLLAIKVDGPTKEDYVWGFRVGFISYGIQGGTAPLYEALEAKTGGAIRGNISNSPNPSQSMLVKAWSSPSYDAEKKEKFAILKARYDRIKTILSSHPEYREAFVALPYNSGYFMCVKPVKVDPEAIRQKLLQEYSTGVIVLGGVIRLAFSATPIGKLEKLFENLYAAARSLSG